MHIESTVNRLVKKYKTNNPFELSDYLGILVILLPLQGVKGLYQYFQRNRIIYIDSMLSDCEKEIVCAHELGHAILHKKTNSTLLNLYSFNNFTNKLENEAIQFASFLILSKYDESEIKELNLEQISLMTGISVEAVKKYIINLMRKDKSHESSNLRS